MIAAYLRVSTDEQRRNQTIETQRSEFQRFCAGKVPPPSVWRVYEDNGVSGTISLDRREQGRLLLNDARAGHFDELVVWKWDRLGRNLHDFLGVLEDLGHAGVKVTAITQPTSEDSSGRLLRNILGAFAEHERSQTIERSVAGTRRLARDGVWLGGIVPYGYRVNGSDKDARLVLSGDNIPGFQFSEAEVIQRIFRKAADGESCVVIANYLNRLGVPPSYARDARAVLRGKRKQHTLGIWRPSRIRNTIVSKTYMGVHEWGKRKIDRDQDGKHLKLSSPDQWIVRQCPSIVDKDLWARANATLRQNQIVAMAHAKNKYLLRGLIHCGMCGLTYIGLAATRPNGKKEFYYRCNGKHGARGLYGEKGQRCPSPSVNGQALETWVWGQILNYLARPGQVIRDLERQMREEGQHRKGTEDEIRELEAALARKEENRKRALTLYTDGMASYDEAHQQLQRIEREASEIARALNDLRKIAARKDAEALGLQTAKSLLTDLRSKMDGDQPWEKRRRIVEILVDRITVDRIAGQKQPNVKVRFRFDSHFDRWTQSDSALRDTDARAASTAMLRASAAARRASFNAT
ncbi:MAG TPA: recombinase family protein [Bryobacteraceae bacterium]|nr:recombinase family protein [Bryobacteraceae bacterium]